MTDGIKELLSLIRRIITNWKSESQAI